MPNRTTEDRLTSNREKQRHIILLASKRTGSSFLGEIFNRNPEVMYVFEPLFQFTEKVIGGKMNADVFDAQSKDRYMLIRFEDIAKNPLNKATDIYNFVQLEMPIEVKQWISNNTNITRGDPFSTTRNSADVATQ
uniref:Carbohydrate sulfotransferase 1-like n=1 Tax=Saccoglossus kowalevskii TaxID=10224 RepID=A0ABM0M395_SACKO